jgi:hypothetical protein
MSETSGAGPLTLLGELAADVVGIARRSWLKSQSGREARAAERAARLAEQRLREQWRAWLAAVERQSRQVSAGDAIEREALEALAGRRNPLDNRKFR